VQAEHRGSIRLTIPLYRQHYDVTCGPACLMMAMQYLDHAVRFGKELEIDIWREGTFVVVPGTSRFGLAFSAAVRGFSVRTTSNTGGIDFVETLDPPVGDGEMALLKEQFFERRSRCRGLGVRERRAAITAGTVRRSLREGRVPLMVTSSLFYSDDDLPHWVTGTGIDDRFMYFINPGDLKPRTRKVGVDNLAAFIGYHGEQSMVEVWKN